MTAPQYPLREESPAVSSISPEQTRWTWLPLARRIWIVLALLLLAYFVASIPVAYQASSTLCTLPDPTQCANGQLSLGNVQALSQLHLSVTAYVGFTFTLFVAVSLLYWVVGLLIFWRTSREWIGLFYSLLLVVVGATAQMTPVLAAIAVTASTPPLLPLLVAVSQVLNVVQPAAIPAFLVTFPTGRLMPRWSAVLIVPIVVANVFPNSPNPVVNVAQTFAWLLPYVGIIGVQIYRYRRVYDAVQRQQTKWFIFVVVIAVALLAIASVPTVIVPSLSAPDSWYPLVGNVLWSLPLALLPLIVGVTILRYHLWDIDVLINRALVYASLTALLVALYFGLILALQALVRALTGSLTQQPLVLVASTLAIAALFQPLRRRIQSTIDGRFYRRKYDAAKVVAAFSSTLRQEVDLNQLREHLVAVVQETMQPTGVAVWLKEPTSYGSSRVRPAREAEDPGLNGPLSDRV